MSPHSIAKAEIEPIGGGVWRLESSFIADTYEVGVLTTVPVGYETDGATIPKILWPVVGHPFTGEYIDPAIEHDYRCDNALITKDYEARCIADSIFFYQLKQHGVSRFKRWCLFAGVIIGRLWRFRVRGGKV